MISTPFPGNDECEQSNGEIYQVSTLQVNTQVPSADTKLHDTTAALTLPRLELPCPRVPGQVLVGRAADRRITLNAPTGNGRDEATAKLQRVDENGFRVLRGLIEIR